MPTIIHQTPLYNFMYFIDKYGNQLDWKILDCGAGGNLPPLIIFHEFGLEVHGIDVSKDQINRANNYFQSKNVNLKIIYGDMRKIPFENNAFSFVYSYNTIFHLTKEEMKLSIVEMRRVMKMGGFLYVNFMSIEDDLSNEGEEQAEGEFLLLENNEKTLHTFLRDEEVVNILEGFEILSFEKRYVKRPVHWKDYMACYFDIIARKI
ncbi:MAG: class I SAM-dependent methyltransferase [Candidatus Heimdallarchaeota archaeon]|nr:class I SAM-dependent methyltransferase [Candidatus Heimdallarchaeota archaeon]